MSYLEVLALPMSAIAYLVCATQEMHGVKLMRRHSTQQASKLLDFMQAEISNA